MVNDTIANALETIQCRVVPYSAEWDTGLSIPVQKVSQKEDIFPVQEYDWHSIEMKLAGYIDMVLDEARRAE